MKIKDRAHEIIETISEKQLVELIGYMEYLKVKDELEATEEILQDSNLMESIRLGLRQYENGEIVDFDVIKDV